MRDLVTMAVLCFALAACGNPTPNSSNNQPDGGSIDTGTTSGEADTGGGGNNGVDCAAVSEQFIDAVRAMPRTCATSDECKIVNQAQVCDCDLAVSVSTDTATYDALRTQMDAGQCSNPFGCPTGECPYRRLSDPGELVANCNDDGMCEVAQVVSCAEYEANANGGIVASGSCMDANQCQLRSDLNPCGCAEAISSNFPFLTVQATIDMMEINDERCNVECTGCDTGAQATCGSNAEGVMVCQTM